MSINVHNKETRIEKPNRRFLHSLGQQVKRPKRGFITLGQSETTRYLESPAVKIIEHRLVSVEM